MKLKLLFAFIALSLVSCSSDDSSTGKDPSQNPGEKKLREIIQTEFNDNGSVKQTTKTQFDDLDRTLAQFGYDGNGTLSSKKDYAYNSSGMLESVTAYTVQNNVQTPDYSYTLGYDAAGKVINRNDSGTQTAVTNYTYNANNTVTVIRTTGSTSLYTTYHINAAGQLFKKVTETETELLMYMGSNIINYSNSTLSSSFVYDGIKPVKGQLLNVVENQYKGNMVNALMIEGLTAVDLGITQYVLQRVDNNGSVYDYDYQFDNEGYPTKVKCYKNESSIPFP